MAEIFTEVERIYGDASLEEALANRNASVSMFADIIGKVISRQIEIYYHLSKKW